MQFHNYWSLNTIDYKKVSVVMATETNKRLLENNC